MCKKTSAPTVLLILLIFLSLAGSCVVTYSQSESELLPTKFKKVIENINMTEIQDHVSYLSNLGSRVSGYEGSQKASEYIAEKFSEYDIQPYGADEGYFEYFNITVPIDHGASITLDDGSEMEAYIFWPNLVNPCPYNSPPEGDKLVYIGGGDFFEYEETVEGKFVLMDFDSRWLFRMAIVHGAKGAIFTTHDESLMNRADAEQKIVFIPIAFPRLYVSPEDGGKLIQLCREKGEANIHVSANMTWEWRTVRNIVGYIEGTDPHLSKQAIVISAYYDSWSVIPKLSPGATDALGIAVLLNLAKFLAENPTPRSVILLATTGHWQYAWGSREYIERHFDEIGTKIVLYTSMDLASDSEALGAYARGASYPFTYPQVMNPRYSWLVTKLFQDYLTQIRLTLQDNSYGASFIDGVLLTHPPYIQSIPPYDPAAATVYGAIPMGYAAWWRSFGLTFDADPFVSATYGSGFTFHTSNAYRFYQRTPHDVYENIQFENVYTQAIFIFCSVWGLANEDRISLYLNPSRVQSDWGYCTLNVIPSEYNMITAYWDPINATSHPELWDNVIVRVSTLPVGATGGGTVAGVPAGGAAPGAGVVGGLIGGGIGAGGLDIITKIDKEGKAVIHGLKPYVPASVDVFVVNRTNGRIEWSTDIGVFQAPGGKSIAMSTPEYTKLISTFPCASVTIFSAYNPIDFRFVPPGGILVYNARSHGPMIRQNSLQFDIDFIAFIRPEVKAEILLSMGERFPIAVINNASDEIPTGSGYYLGQGEAVTVGPDEIAKNLYFITNSRYGTLYTYQTYTPTMNLYHGFASSDADILDFLDETKSLSAVYGYSYSLWATTLMTYSSVMDLVWQVLATLSFFFLVSIIATLTLERLLFSYEGLKRIVSTIILFAVTQIMLGLLHPGYSIATNAFVSLLSVGMLFIVLPLIAFIISEVLRSAEEVRRKMVGAHFAEISRTGMVSHSYSVGLRVMKKRSLRTTLTIVSLAVIVSSMVTFASVTISPVLMKQELGITPRYEALLVRRVPWTANPEETYLYVKSFMAGRGIVAPRAWLYAPPLPAGVTSQATGQTWIIFSPKAKTRITSFMAFAPEEAEISHIDDLLVDGMWFTEEDIYSCILPDTLAGNLSQELGRPIGVGSDIGIWGMNLKVVGIIRAAGLTDFVDLDNEWITPIDTTVTQPTSPPHHPGQRNVIIPYQLYARMAFPTLIMTIAVKPFNSSEIPVLAEEFALKTVFDVFYGMGGKTYVIRARQWIQLMGATQIWIPIIIASLTILSLMLGNVSEREGEIKIYNAVGMSPSHITQMFLVESLSYATPAVVIGYLGGILSTVVLIQMGFYPVGLYPNFSSLIILVIMGIDIAMVLSAAIYPALLLSRLAVPSLTRRWKVAKPQGDLWQIPLPFVATKTETNGFFEFFREYLMSYSLERYGTFHTLSISFDSETKPEGEIVKTITTRMRLAPYDLGIEQDASIVGVSREVDTYVFTLNIQRIRGYRDQWITSNRPFMDTVRKQWLIWRALPPSEREKYIEKAKDELKV